MIFFSSDLNGIGSVYIVVRIQLILYSIYAFKSFNHHIDEINKAIKPFKIEYFIRFMRRMTMVFFLSFNISENQNVILGEYEIKKMKRKTNDIKPVILSKITYLLLFKI